MGEGRSILSAALSSDHWEVAGICDLSEELCQQRCREANIAPCYTVDYGEMLANPKVDTVGIYTPDHLHAAHVIAALRAGKNVICTKPLLDRLDQAKEILDLVESTGLRVFVGQSTRFFEPFSRQREHFGTGELGEIITIEAQYHADHRWFLEKPWARESAFKWLYGCISHPADLIRWYLGEIDEVMGYASLSANGRVGGLAHEDTFHFILRSASGTIARISGAYSGPTVPAIRDSGLSCVLRCSEGASQADYHELRYTCKVGDRQWMESFDHKANHYFRFAGVSHHAGEYQNYLDYFARCLDSGEKPLPDASEGVVTLALLRAMEISIHEGRPVKVDDVLRENGLK